jgi:PsbP
MSGQPPIATEVCRLSDLGTPEQVADFLFKSYLAPPGSGIAFELQQASSRSAAKGLQYYELEYKVRKEQAGWRRHNLSVLCARNGILYTLNAQCRADRWDQYAQLYRKAADSFVLS